MKHKIGNASAADLKNGFLLTERPADKAKIYSCLFCHTQYDSDEVYTFGRLMVNGKKAIKMHISKEHGSVFEALLSSDKMQTGLTGVQKEFLVNYYSGMRDRDIAEKMNISASTVRYQRHNFREKAKQAKFILALSELLEEREIQVQKPIDENEKMLEILFSSLSPLILKTFDFKKRKDEKRNLVLRTIIEQFEKGRKYTEKEVNVILSLIYSDYATIRRSLVDSGLMERTDNCREYWVK